VNGMPVTARLKRKTWGCPSPVPRMCRVWSASIRPRREVRARPNAS